MCVIIHKPADKKLPLVDLRNAWSSNNDGAGIVIPSRCPKVFKGIMKLKHLENILTTLQDQELLIHLRYATHGAITKDNTHPFKCGRDRWLMHNGVLTQWGSSGTTGNSDSAHLAEDLSPLRAEALRRILETIPGKFAFVNRERVTLHGVFIERNGIMYSNTSWLPYKSTYSNYRDNETYKKWREDQDKKDDEAQDKKQIGFSPTAQKALDILTREEEAVKELLKDPHYVNGNGFAGLAD